MPVPVGLNVWSRLVEHTIVQGIIRQGAHRLTVNFADVPRPEGTLLFAETVLPHLRAA